MLGTPRKIVARVAFDRLRDEDRIEPARAARMVQPVEEREDHADGGGERVEHRQHHQEHVLSPASRSRASRMENVLDTRFRWVSMAPFGRPVVPDV